MGQVIFISGGNEKGGKKEKKRGKMIFWGKQPPWRGGNEPPE